MPNHPLRRQRNLALILLIVLFGSFSPAQAKAETLNIAAPDSIRPYAPDVISLTLPEAGELRLWAQIGQEDFPLFPVQTAKSGPLSLPFEGLSGTGEPLPQGDMVIKAQLEAANRQYEAQQSVKVLKPEPAIAYAILARERLPASGGEDLLVDYQLTSVRQLNVAIARADNPEIPVRTWALQPNSALPRHFRWNKTISDKPATPGDYLISFSLKGSAQPALVRAFTLTEQAEEAPVLAPSKSGEWLPLQLDDASVWAAIIAPTVVLDIGDMAHQHIYAQPSTKSESLGFVHGQTAGLELLELGVEGFARVRAARHGDGEMITGFVPEGKLMVIMPDTRYGILVDKASQTLRLYEAGAYVGTLSVSTGVYVPPGTSSFETLSGAFLTQDRIATFRQDGFQYDYALRIDGGNLIHQAGYQVRQGRDFSEQHAALGAKASHGCVRVDSRPNAQMINAWWLYANLPRNTKVLVVEDAALLGAVPKESPTATDTPSPDPTISPAPPLTLKEPAGGLVVTLSFVGDCVLGSEEQARNQANSFDSVVAEKGFDWPFSGFIDYFSQDDLTLVNLEGVLMDSSQDRNLSRQHNFRGPTAFTQILAAGSVEAVNIANNHYPDYGAAGKRSTRNALSAASLGYSGYSALHIYEKEGIKVGFAGIRETIYHQDKNRISREVAELKAAGCQYVVYSIHAGEEYASFHNALQTEMAHAAIEAGANLVIGHHPHVPQGIELYQDGLIFYSLGNFVFGGNLNLSTFDALAAQISLYFEGNSLLQTQVQLIPLLTSGTAPQNDFRPIPAQGLDKERILETVNQDSQRPFPEFFSLPVL